MDYRELQSTTDNHGRTVSRGEMIKLWDILRGGMKDVHILRGRRIRVIKKVFRGARTVVDIVAETILLIF